LPTTILAHYKIAQPYDHQIKLLLTVLGISDRLTAIRIIAEIGVDMSEFESAKHLTSWAGLTPQNAENAGKKKTTRVGKAGTYIKPLLVELAMSVGRSSKKHPEMYAKYKQIQKRRGGKKAHIAMARRLLVAIYHIFLKDEPFNVELYREAEKVPKSRTFEREAHALAYMRSHGFVITEDSTVPESAVA
jgi:hypothetical protein